jgi:hypothetical protein
VLKDLVFSVADAEFGAVFVNAKEGGATHKTLSEMGQKQQDSTKLKTYNSTAYVIINNKVKQKCSKAIDMQLNKTNSI